MKKSEFILSRHAEKIRTETSEEEKSEEYLGVTKEGEKETREKTKEIAKIIEELPEETVVILSGVSDIIRTRSTLKIHGDELRNIFKDRNDIIFIPKEKEKKDEPIKTLREIKRILEEQSKEIKKGKIIIQIPLKIKQFIAPLKEWEEWEKYYKSLGKPADEEIKEWIVGEKDPNPEKLAKDFLIGLQREEKFFRGIFPEKPLVYINVSHGGGLDALFTYLANEGKITREGFERIGDKEVKESEFSRLSFLPDGEIIFEYRGQQFSCPPDLFKTEEKKCLKLFLNEEEG